MFSTNHLMLEKIKNVVRKLRSRQEPAPKGDQEKQEPELMVHDSTRPVLTIEGLPYELKVAILTRLPDLATLSALIHASPSFHQVYAAERVKVLSTVTIRDIDPALLPEALATLNSAKLTFEGTTGTKTWETFLDDYARKRRDNVLTPSEKFERASRLKTRADFLADYARKRMGNVPAPRDLDFDDILQLAHMRMTIHILTADFCRSAINCYPGFVAGHLDEVPLSPTECFRIHRGFYRYQLYCNLFTIPSPLCEKDSDGQDRSHVFLSLFLAWETEELACIHDYIMHKYTMWFQEIAADVSREAPRFQDELARCPGTPVGCYDLSPDDMFYTHRLESVMAYGLPLMLKALRNNHDELIETITENIRGRSQSLLRVLEAMSLQDCYQEGEEWDDEQNGVALIMTGDATGPNEAWCRTNDYQVTTGYYEWWAEDWRRWAYVIWDSERLRTWNAAAVLIREEPKETIPTNIDYSMKISSDGFLIRDV
ncbi:hypothetical protein MMC13_002194 [Lambiella insularis]|nr:hypothetical protein [Lambiella insularis]